MHEHASKMELGDKETIAICIQASVTCYLHVINIVIRVRVWSYRTRTIYKIVPYVWYIPYAVHTIRVWYVPYAYGIKYAYGT